MHYDLTRLGPREFEHLAQALFQRYAEAGTTVFGDGPDGGREATWIGALGPSSRLPQGWDGYGVLQAKYRVRPSNVPKENAEWLIGHLKKEIDGWLRSDSKRDRIPDYILAVTNIVLTPANGGGLETVRSEVAAYAKRKGLPLKDFDVWHFDSIRALLDDAADIRRAYAAWITPGDVLAVLYDQVNGDQVRLSAAMSNYAAKTLVDDTLMNLTQAGAVGDAPIRLDEIFIDLPTNDSPWDRTGHSGIASHLLASGSVKSATADGNSPNRFVIIGGPGQGKSTVGQFLCQLYRANFVIGSPILDDPEVDEAARQIIQRSEFLQLPAVKARRWPVRVVLTDLADAIADESSTTLLGYISTVVSRRSGYAIGEELARKALRDYPWFLVLDGLDEVPRSGNRDKVLQAVKDFLIDAAGLEADVMVVATTRPQGYDNDFDPRRFAHRELRPLGREEAVAYATSLSAIRMGEGSERYRKVLTRIRRAAEEEATSRLMSSPLQVTIMTLLIERQGKAPKDRWRLFSEYYRVIYQREQEKGGPLADLLTDFEADINAIHYRAGYELQARAERAGDADSVLASSDFRELVSNYLRGEGHDDAAVQSLADRLEEVATERLVFLTSVREGVVGFEVRSLQEFMAGEFVIDLPESTIPDSLRRVALSAHWRNAFLFAIGKIFAERPALKGEVVNLCNLLNSSNRIEQSVLAGSRLALQIILDGAPHNQPRYRDSLAACATQLIAGPVSRDIPLLARLHHANAADQLRGALRRAAGHGPQSQVNGARVWSALVESGDASATDFSDFLETCSGEAVQSLLELAWSGNDESLLRLLAVRSSSLSVARLLDENRAAYFESSDDGALAIDERADVDHHWQALNALRSLCITGSPHDRDDLEVRLSREPTIGLHFRPMGADVDSWRHVANLESATGVGWAVLRAVARFEREPGHETLADALDAFAESSPDSLPIARLASWPIWTCVSDARSAATGARPPEVWLQVIARLGSLAGAARSGDLGTQEDWSLAEHRWRQMSIDQARRELAFDWAPLPGSASEIPRPMDPSIGQRGLITRTHSASLTHDGTDFSLAAIADLAHACKRFKPSDRRRGLANVLGFVMSAQLESMSRNGNGIDPFPPFAFEVLEFLTREGVGGWMGGLGWLKVMPSGALANRDIEELLFWAGRQPRAAHGVYQAAPMLGARWESDPEAWPLGRLALFGGTVPYPPPALSSSGNPMEGRLRAACALLLGTWGDDRDQMVRDMDVLQDAGSSDGIDAWFVITHSAFLDGVESCDEPSAQVAGAILETYGSSDPLLCGTIADRLLAAAEGMHSGVQL